MVIINKADNSPSNLTVPSGRIRSYNFGFARSSIGCKSLRYTLTENEHTSLLLWHDGAIVLQVLEVAVDNVTFLSPELRKLMNGCLRDEDSPRRLGTTYHETAMWKVFAEGEEDSTTIEVLRMLVDGILKACQEFSDTLCDQTHHLHGNPSAPGKLLIQYGFQWVTCSEHETLLVRLWKEQHTPALSLEGKLKLKSVYECGACHRFLAAGSKENLYTSFARPQISNAARKTPRCKLCTLRKWPICNPSAVAVTVPNTNRDPDSSIVGRQGARTTTGGGNALRRSATSRTDFYIGKFRLIPKLSCEERFHSGLLLHDGTAVLEGCLEKKMTARYNGYREAYYRHIDNNDPLDKQDTEASWTYLTTKKGEYIEAIFQYLNKEGKIFLFEEPDVVVLNAMIPLSHTLRTEMIRRSDVLARLSSFSLTVAAGGKHYETWVLCPKTSTVKDLVMSATKTFPWSHHRVPRPKPETLALRVIDEDMVEGELEVESELMSKYKGCCVVLRDSKTVPGTPNTSQDGPRDDTTPHKTINYSGRTLTISAPPMKGEAVGLHYFTPYSPLPAALFFH